jgi:hypothetical protein
MARNRKSDRQETGGVLIRFNLVGLILFSVSLIAAASLLTSGVLTRHRSGVGAESGHLPPAPFETPPWGELATHEIEVEPPEEYLAADAVLPQAPAWVFQQLSPEQTRSLMLSCGLSAEQADRALAPDRVSVAASNTIVRPDDELILSLSREARAKLYATLGRWQANHFMVYPFSFRVQNLDESFENSNLDTATIARIKKLLYKKGEAECFSDFEFVMRGLPSDRQRLWLVKTLARQRALLVRVRIRPDTDLEKVLGYWDRGISVKDARPLLESVKRLPEGGSVSLLYLLPRFARERLYTFPMPPRPGEWPVDCHWTTMNFFNDEPDNRFADPAYTVACLKTNYYQIAKANQYGDIILVLNKEGYPIHSATYLADDIVFTKNGDNHMHPWMLVRMKDLLATYTADSVQVAAYRNRNW